MLKKYVSLYRRIFEYFVVKGLPRIKYMTFFSRMRDSDLRSVVNLIGSIPFGYFRNVFPFSKITDRISLAFTDTFLFMKITRQ